MCMVDDRHWPRSSGISFVLYEVLPVVIFFAGTALKFVPLLPAYVQLLHIETRRVNCVYEILGSSGTLITFHFDGYHPQVQIPCRLITEHNRLFWFHI